MEKFILAGMKCRFVGGAMGVIQVGLGLVSCSLLVVLLFNFFYQFGFQSLSLMAYVRFI